MVVMVVGKRGLGRSGVYFGEMVWILGMWDDCWVEVEIEGEGGRGRERREGRKGEEERAFSEDDELCFGGFSMLCGRF